MVEIGLRQMMCFTIMLLEQTALQIKYNIALEYYREVSRKYIFLEKTVINLFS